MNELTILKKGLFVLALVFSCVGFLCMAVTPQLGAKFLCSAVTCGFFSGILALCGVMSDNK